MHDGNQQFLQDSANPGRFHQILTMYDPWDEEKWDGRLRASRRFLPHGPLTNAQLWRASREFLNKPVSTSWNAPSAHSSLTATIPTTFSALHCVNPHIGITAFYREQRNDALDMDYPYVLRMVELDGVATTTEIAFPGKVARAHKTNLLGERVPTGGDLRATECAPPPGMPPTPRWSRVRVPMRPYEIATLYLDLELGRKVSRDLDAKRSVWATVHKETSLTGGNGDVVKR
jgi:hypothetical protein